MTPHTRTPAELAESIFAILRNCVGRDQAKKGTEISDELMIVHREVRRIIARESSGWSKRLGTPLLATPGGGFYFPTEAEEITRRHRFLISAELAAKTKRRDFEVLIHTLGFGGLVTESVEATR